MKIAFVDDGIYAYASKSLVAVGGAEREQWLLARALAGAGWSATVGVRNLLKAGERQVIDGVEYVGIGQEHLLLASRKFLAAERPNWLLRKCATHLWGPLVEIAKLANVNTIFHAAHDLDINPRRAPLYRPRWWPLYSWGLSRTDRIFVQHSAQLAGLKRRWRSKACVLPKVCEVDPVKPIKSHSSRQEYVAWVGTLGHFKRPDTLVDIAAKTPSICFRVCGGVSGFAHSSPEFGKRIVERLRALPNVHYLGHVAPQEAAQVIANAALLLSTSDAEGFPNTFVQAWSSGTPVVTLRIDPDRIIERWRLGAIAGSPDRAITNIVSLMAAPEQRDEIAARAIRFVHDNYSATKVVTRFERAVRERSPVESMG